MSLPLKTDVSMLLVLVACLLFTACGFKPVYRQYEDGGALAGSLAAIKVTPLDYDRQAQVLYTSLVDLLNPARMNVPVRYVLTVQPERKREGAAILRNREITRYNVSVTARYTLNDLATGKTIHRGVSRMSGSYDVSASEFASYTAEQDAATKIMEEIAKDIRFQLTTRFLDDPEPAPASAEAQTTP